MITKIQGKKYSFEVVSQEQEIEFCFFIRAIDKLTRRASCINNLNTILSEFSMEVDDPKVADSTWVVTKEDARRLQETAKDFLSSSSFLHYLERRLDEDRKCGEWENIVAV